MIAEPHMKVVNGDISPGAVTKSPKTKSTTLGASPATMITGINAKELNKLVYQLRWRAEPLTTSRLFLMTTEWMAVIMEDATPKKIPTAETGVPSRKTPTKNPMVTTAHAARIRREGRACRRKKDVPTVNGRTMPRAT